MPTCSAAAIACTPLSSMSLKLTSKCSTVRLCYTTVKRTMYYNTQAINSDQTNLQKSSNVFGTLIRDSVVTEIEMRCRTAKKTCQERLQILHNQAFGHHRPGFGCHGNLLCDVMHFKIFSYLPCPSVCFSVILVDFLLDILRWILGERNQMNIVVYRGVSLLTCPTNDVEARL